MKTADDYGAKIAYWAAHPRVVALPRLTGVPRFGAKRFNSYEELNAWKRELLDRIAEQDGVKWTK